MPDLAELFSVSTDELLGVKIADSFENIYLSVRKMFEETSRDDVMDMVFRLAILLHEAVVSQGYKEEIPWDITRESGLSEKTRKWGMSAVSEEYGSSVYAGNSMFFSNLAMYEKPKAWQIREIAHNLKNLTEKNVLRVYFALYDMTAKNFDMYITLDEIADYTKLTHEEIEAALDNIPITIKEDGKVICYRINGGQTHIPPLLMLIGQNYMI